MALKVSWSYEATSDLNALAEYISRDSPFYASSFVQEIFDASRSLDTLYERGRIVPEFANSSIRELFVRDYRLIYSIEMTRIVVLGLIHGKRNLKKLWEEEQRTT